MRVLYIIVHPYAVDQIQRFIPSLVVRIESIIKLIRLDGIDTDGVGTHFLNVAKPAIIAFLVNIKIRGPLPRLTGTDVHTFDFKGLPLTVFEDAELCSLGFDEGGHRLARVHIDIPAKVIIGIVSENIKRNKSGNNDDKLFHSSSSQSAFSLYFFTADSAENSRTASIF